MPAAGAMMCWCCLWNLRNIVDCSWCWLPLYYYQNYKKRDHTLNAKYRLEWKKQTIIKRKVLFSHIKIGKEIIAFGNIETEKLFFKRYRYWECNSI